MVLWSVVASHLTTVDPFRVVDRPRAERPCLREGRGHPLLPVGVGSSSVVLRPRFVSS